MGKQESAAKAFFGLTMIALCIGACAEDISLQKPRATQVVDASKIRTHMKILAADDMEGRETGTKGYLRAARYVAKAFDKFGFEPMGDNGTYYQSIDFISTQLVESSGNITLHKGQRNEPLLFGEDFVQGGGFGEKDELITAPLIFVGFGIRAPENNHDDYAEIDPAGKIVIAFSGAPPAFTANERAYYSSTTEKQQLAVSKGAISFVSVFTPVDQKRTPWSRIQNGIGASSMRWVDDAGIVQDGFPTLIGSATLSHKGARKVFDLAGRDLDQLFNKHLAGERGSFDLGVIASISRQSNQEHISSPNVIGFLPGSDPQLRDEVLIYSAHLDHLGLNLQGEIYNGAYDNAAGVGVVLDIARIMSEQAPRRSIIFVAYTAEEKGLRGSDYLAHYPPVPIGNIVANINVDMPFFGVSNC